MLFSIFLGLATSWHIWLNLRLIWSLVVVWDTSNSSSNGVERKKLIIVNRQVRKGVVDLPWEITFEIMSRLPIESILRCRVVCKTWHTATRDPCFIKKFRNSNYQTIHLILKEPWIKNHLVWLDIEEQKPRQIPIDNMLTKFVQRFTL